jgi:hypothetical protein
MWGYMTATAGTSGNVATFYIDNTDGTPETYGLHCGYDSAVVDCDVAGSVYVDGWGSVTVNVSFTTGSSGVGGVRLMVGSEEGDYQVTVLDPHETPVVVATSGGNMRDVTKCVADCFENVLTYSAPAYMSRDVARAVSLVYRSDLTPNFDPEIMSVR